ncbi:MAG: hypothetical protein AAFU85_07250 [Planctomycetota bacterium]
MPFFILAALFAVPAGGQEEIPAVDVVDLVMYDDPRFEYPESRYEIPQDPIRVWTKALDRTEDSELLRATIDSIVIADQLTMEGLDVFIPRLVELLETEDLEHSVRRSAAAALIRLNARDQAKILAEQATQFGESLSELVEPALAVWKHDPMEAVWLQRLDRAEAGRRALIRAMRGLGELQSTKSVASLVGFVENSSAAQGVRLAAARALGHVRSPEQLALADRLIAVAKADVLSGIMAVAVLDQRDDAETIATLKLLVASESSTVQAEALRALYEIDPLLPIEFVDAVIESPDVNVRWPVARSMVRSHDDKWIESLAMLLNDVNPSLRSEVAASLVYLANEHDLRDEVIAESSRVLAKEEWRGCEQAGIVLVNLEEKSISDRLVQLMEHPRGEVQVTAGWGLRRFALEQHLPAMLRRAEAIYAGFRSKELTVTTPGAEGLITQLFMAFGKMRFQEADGLIRKYLPKDFSLGDNSRTAAAWAIGFLHEGKATPDVTQTLVGRLNDVVSLFPEIGSVRGMAAISLARMNSESAIPDLRKFMIGDGAMADQACGWAVEQMTGDPKPPVRKGPLSKYNKWFLAPLKPAEEQ